VWWGNLYFTEIKNDFKINFSVLNCSIFCMLKPYTCKRKSRGTLNNSDQKTNHSLPEADEDKLLTSFFKISLQHISDTIKKNLIMADKKQQQQQQQQQQQRVL
jgi:hypothetical protein